MSSTLDISAGATPTPKTINVRRWATFFALAYVVQGMSQYSNILYQPINFFFKETHNYGADQLAHLGFILTFPWYFKPVYGLLSDFVPFFGYRRRSYLLLITILSTGAMTWLGFPGLRNADAIVTVLLITSLGAAMGDVMVDGLMVERGQASGRIKFFQGIQWVSVTGAAFFASLAGGWLAERATEDPALALHNAARIAIAGPIILFVATWILAEEKKSKLSKEALAQTFQGIKRIFRSKPLWGAALFIFAFWFQPGLNSPMYVHATETIGISEFQYGSASAWGQSGYVLGALLFALYLGKRFSTRQCAILSVVLYTSATLAYLGFYDYTTYLMCNICIAFAWMISTLTMLSLAAEVCPKRVEAFTFAGLMAISNFSFRYSEKIGGNLYENAFERNIAPLIWISAGATALAIVLLPLLPKNNKPQQT